MRRRNVDDVDIGVGDELLVASVGGAVRRADVGEEGLCPLERGGGGSCLYDVLDVGHATGAGVEDKVLGEFWDGLEVVMHEMTLGDIPPAIQPGPVASC